MEFDSKHIYQENFLKFHYEQNSKAKILNHANSKWKLEKPN